ncbi:MAG: hypothetical protein RLZZ234_614 [Candidatus Parcubacteria bacterium]|jgi:hypothetical protein
MTTTDRSTLFLAFAFGVGIMGLLAFAMPSTASAHNGLKGANHHASSTKSVDLTCMQTAVGVRETAVGAAYDKHTTAMKAALTDRKAALNTAWGITDAKARNSAVKAAWMEFRKDRMASRKTMSGEKKSAWATFKTTAKTSCKTTLPKEEGESNDSDV